MKAYDDWRGELASLENLNLRITKNPKGNLAKKLIEADSNWSHYNFDQKHEILEILSHEICHIFKIRPVGIFNLKNYNTFCKEHGLTEILHEFDKNCYGFYAYHKAAGVEYMNIVFPDESKLSSLPFLDVLNTLFHELGHAIIDEQMRKIENKIKEQGYAGWNNIENYLSEDFLENLESVGFLKFYELRNKKMRRAKTSAFRNMIENYDAKNDTYTNENAYHKFIMSWEERCAEYLGRTGASIIYDALVQIGHTPQAIENTEN
ncbi:MAG: hypothetical protein KDI13_02190 [Alphaproteobacteria bacterium]|nr:hypothetical protein [Alphaproteobacteria bacterium]